jgi:hypothetical protein
MTPDELARAKGQLGALLMWAADNQPVWREPATYVLALIAAGSLYVALSAILRGDR